MSTIVECPVCHAKLPPGAAECPHCRQNAGGKRTATMAAPPPPPPPVKPSRPRPYAGRTLSILSGVSAIASLLIWAAAYSMSQGHSVDTIFKQLYYQMVLVGSAAVFAVSILGIGLGSALTVLHGQMLATNDRC